MTAPGPVTLATPVAHAGPLPEAADLVVIGGGVAGVSAAYFAAQAGAKVVLLEKGRIAGEQSSRNWGWIRQQGRDPAELPIMIEANRLWQDFAKQTNDEIGLRQTGTLYLSRTRAAEERHEAWLPHAAAHGLDTRMIGAAELAQMLPGAVPAWRAALWTASDLRAEPWVAVPVLARLTARAGVTLREHCAVRRLDVAAGQVAGVETEAGRIRAPLVLLAGGAWSRLFLELHGIALPQLSVRASVCATGALPTVFPGQAADDRLAFRRRADGGYSLALSDAHDLFLGRDALRSLPSFLKLWQQDPFRTGLRPAAPKHFPDAWTTARDPLAFERRRVLSPAPNLRLLGRVVRRFQNAFPDLPEVRVKRSWAGMIDLLPDLVPVIDRAEALPGLTVLTGLSGHGFGIGPGVGRAAAHLALGRDVGHDLSRFRLSRFAKGAKLEVGPQL